MAVRGAAGAGPFLVVQANIRAEGDMVKLTAQSADDLEARAVGRMKGLEIHFSESTPLAPLRTILDRQGSGPGQILFRGQNPATRNVEVGLKERYALSPAFAPKLMRFREY